MVVPQNRRSFLALIRNAAVATGLVAAAPISALATENHLPILEIENSKFTNAKKLLASVEFSDWSINRSEPNIRPADYIKERTRKITVWLDNPFKLWIWTQYADVTGQVELEELQIETVYFGRKSKFNNFNLIILPQSKIQLEKSISSSIFTNI